MQRHAYACFYHADADSLLAVSAKRERFLAALANLLHNAFNVTLNTCTCSEQILIDVSDRCGRRTLGYVEKMFASFSQGSH